MYTVELQYKEIQNYSTVHLCHCKHAQLPKCDDVDKCILTKHCMGYDIYSAIISETSSTKPLQTTRHQRCVCARPPNRRRQPYPPPNFRPLKKFGQPHPLPNFLYEKSDEKYFICLLDISAEHLHRDCFATITSFCRINYQPICFFSYQLTWFVLDKGSLNVFSRKTYYNKLRRGSDSNNNRYNVFITVLKGTAG